MRCTQAVLTKAARKRHWCDWCQTSINPGESYKSYRSYDGSEASTVKMHLECYEAGEELQSIEPGALSDGWTGSFKRGCYCDTGCDRCLILKSTTGEIK